ncbi:hypothetical protein [Streptomyces sp. NPDC056817]|uniref:hypothetical protein n=1 Tax=Streptomyces sp. NPDC056817 TaxID=3345950 RepID=UPI0036ADBDB7
MSNRPRTADLAKLDPDLPAAVREFLTDLRTYFHQLDVSARVYASRRHLDPSTVSRYLSGKRPVPWKFVEDLLDDVAEHCGVGVTAEAVKGLQALHKADRQARQPVSELDRMEDRVRHADHEVRRLRAEERQLAQALQASEAAHKQETTRRQGAEAELEELKNDHRMQARDLVQWRGMSLGLCGAFTSLGQQVAWLRQALADTRAALKAAEARRDHLEQQLLAAEAFVAEGISGASLMDVLEAADRTTPVPELVQLIGGLATSPRQAFASELVASASRCRPVQEVTALLSALYTAGLHQHAEAALPALVAMRPVQDAAALVTELLRSGLEEPVVSLLQASVKLHTPSDLASLAGLLQQHGRNEAAVVLLGATATHRTAEETVAVCSLLTLPGFQATLAQAITTPVAARPCAELAALVIQLHRSGFADLAETLQSAIALERTATDVAELIDALHCAKLPDAAAAVFWETQQRTTGHLVALISALHTENRHRDASEVLTRALTSRSGPENARLIVDLHVVGLHQDAFHALITALSSFSPHDVREILQRLDQTHPATDVRSLLTEAAARCSSDAAADMLVSLLNSELHEYAQLVYACTFQGRPTGHAAAALTLLHRRTDQFLTPHTLRAQARLASATEVTHLSLALHAAGLDAQFHAVLSGGVLERHATEAAMVVKILEGLRVLSNGQSTKVINHLLTRLVQDQPVDDQLAWITALEATGAEDTKQRLIKMACQTREFGVKLYALEVSGRLEDRGPLILFLWRLRRLARVFD